MSEFGRRELKCVELSWVELSWAELRLALRCVKRVALRCVALRLRKEREGEFVSE